MASANKIIFGDYLTVIDEGKGVIRVNGCPPGGSGGCPSFSLTGGPFNFNTDSCPITLDGGSIAASDTPHFSTTDASTFAVSSGGRARILVPGMYVIGCQVSTKPAQDMTAQLDVYLMLQYGPGPGTSGPGFSIEIPWAFSTFVNGSERLLGTRFDFPATTKQSEDADVALQRLHPISLTSATVFPLDIRPTFDTNTTVGHLWTVSWLGLWGFRLSDPLDSYHSD
jgi:hypothetical protein